MNQQVAIVESSQKSFFYVFWCGTVERFYATSFDTSRNRIMYTLGTAAKAAGKSKSTLLRAIQNGVISATKGPQGNYQIDPAELHRVYPPVASGGAAQPATPTYAPPVGTLDATLLQAELRELQAKLEAAEQRLKDRAEVIEDLRRRLDNEEEEQRWLTRLLTDQRATVSVSVEKPGGGLADWWRQLWSG